jgi:hypothetical protein
MRARASSLALLDQPQNVATSRFGRPRAAEIGAGNGNECDRG